MKSLLQLTLLLISINAFAQFKIEGKVIDKKNKPLVGANVFIEGTYDGATTNEKGEFLFETTEKGKQILNISLLGFDDLKTPVEIEKCIFQTYVLKAGMNSLDAVVITAGSFKAGDNSKGSVLKPLDIVSTAGSVGDIVGALQTLPGAQVVGESGRLFVRGGESDETQTYIDGVRVAQPYGVSANNMPTRGRFSPFLFKGMTFSTGGYSAEYGDALSSVLLMNSISEPDQDQTDVSFMTVGLGLGKTKKWQKSSLSFNTSYINLQPYQWLVPQKADWNKPYQSISGESIYRYKFNKGLFKLYAAFETAAFDLNQDDINNTNPIRIDNKNNNLYVNSNYKGKFGNGWTITTGGSLGINNVRIGIEQDQLKNQEIASHLKAKLENKLSDKIGIAFGGDYFVTDFDESFKPKSGESFKYGYKSNVGALFAETDFFFSPEFALKSGVRVMRNDLLNKNVFEPRISLAYKVSKASQFSLAYGDFHQAPKQDYLKYFQNLDFEKTQHYILNYMHSVAKRTLRAEVYYKKYDDLIKYNTATPVFNSDYNNQGFGYAKGLDIFWRDSRTFKKIDYWITYTLTDSKRNFKNYSKEVKPTFVADHTLSWVGKYWIQDWKSQISVTNTFASGRPYNNPNQTQFMNGKTKEYNNLSMSWAYLLSQQKILFFSVTNILGRDNVFGYQYANSPDLSGVYQRQVIGQPADRFFFVGFFWTISNDKKTNQLDNL
ncbi:carboxypeptidase-like regulatory domain-containing protein [Flavobacterium sp. H122]|uniref:TonB-dependent receptor n=1 Tax=Flavobacterium sp. H122 TaxID=2529860 RepID=UPI0010AA386A|nr:carboxypeptidase-like regulatory domain-containing protein [Flavobacterium sp. H122]